MKFWLIFTLTIATVFGAFSCNFPPLTAGAQSDGEFQSIKVTQDGNRFDVMATVTNGGNITGIQVNPDYGTILISVETNSDEQSELRIILPRDLIDSRDNSTDSEFFVIVEGEPTEYVELRTTATEREIEIPLPAETSQIEISGNEIIPEFPAAYAVVTVSFVMAISAFAFLRIRPLWKAF
jgi:hypothetical protein